MASILIWYFHPDTDSYNGSILKRVKEELNEAGHSVNIRIPEKELDVLSLSKKEYNASMEGVYFEDIQKEHRYIEKADGIIAVFPLWWGSFPAVGKGFLDRVLSYKFAYELEDEKPIPLMNEKPITFVYTTGTPEEEFEKSGLKKLTEDNWQEHLLSFCGFTSDPFCHLGNVINCSEEDRKKKRSRASAHAEKFAAGITGRIEK